MVKVDGDRECCRCKEISIESESKNGNIRSRIGEREPENFFEVKIEQLKDMMTN